MELEFQNGTPFNARKSEKLDHSIKCIINQMNNDNIAL